MRLPLLLALVLCVALCAGDRRRPERGGDGDGQQRVQHRHWGEDERHHHHHHDAQRQQQWRHDDDNYENDGDDEDDDDDHGHHHRFVDRADVDGSHWRHGHDHRGGDDRHRGHEGHGSRPEDGQGKDQVRRQDGRRDGKKKGHKDGKKNGSKWSDSRRGGDRSDEEHYQDRRRSENHLGERSEHRSDISSKKTRSKITEARHQNAELPQGGHPTQDGAFQSGASEETPSGALPLSAAYETRSPLPLPESVAAALAAEEPEEPEAEPLPPPHQDVAAMARYIVHVSDWAAMATISTRPPTRGMPFANVFSVCDGTRYRSTGVPYLYLTDMEISVKDLRVNNSASLTMSLAQTDFCRRRGYDPEDPLCAHVILTGRVLQVDEQDPEFVFARDALFARHPEMSDWPAGHHFFVAKLDIQNIIVLDYFGGAKTVSLSEYFAANPFKAHPRRENML